MKKGYKNTEIGVIPEDWEVISLGDLLVFKNGLNKEKEFFGFGIPIINYMDVFANSGLKSNNIKGKVSLNNDEIRNYSVKLGDVFFTRTSETQNEIGVSTVLLENIKDCVFSGFILRGRPKTNQLDIFYSKYCFRGNYVRKQIISTSSYTTRALTNGKLLSDVILALPPTLKEQQAIATVLSDTDSLLSNLKILIAKKKAIKQGTMQELLTGKKRLKGFTGEWIEKKVDELAIVSRGRVISKKEINLSSSKLYPVYSSQTVNKGIMGYLDTYDFSGEYLTWTTDGENAGTVFYRNGKFNCTNVCGTLKVKEYDAKFISFVLGITAPKHVSRNLANPKLMNQPMKKIKIRIPKNIKEQQAIAQILTDMDMEIEALESQLQKTENLKQGLMQELLTGKIRLVQPEIENKLRLVAEPRASYGK